MPPRRTITRMNIMVMRMTRVAIMAMITTIMTIATIAAAIITITTTVTGITATPMLITTNSAGPAARAAMTEAEAAALYRLMTWLSPSFPVGGFSYSSGIEWAVEAGDIKDFESLRRWLAAVLGQGGGSGDPSAG